MQTDYRFTRVRRLWAASLAIALLQGTCIMPTARAAQLTESVTFDIAAQALDTALLQFSKQAGIQVLTETQTVAGKTTPGISGEYVAERALAALLQGSGLQYKQISARAVTVSVPNNKRISEAPSSLQLTQADAAAGLAEARHPGEAETQDAKSAASSAADGKVQEIIVSARKTNERLQDVPVSVTAITGEQLKERGAVDVKDVLRSVPGLSFSNVERGQARYNIRGVATNVASPTVGIYLDDVSLVTQSSLFTGAFDAIFFDTERLEVLKGPQGTLYGGSAMGGAIKYVTVKPDLDRVSANVTAGLGSTSHGSESYNAEGIINVPLVDDVLAVRGGVSYRHEGGYIDNVAGLNIENTARSSTPLPTYTPVIRPSGSTQNREDYNFADTYIGRVSLLWQPAAGWSIRPAVLYQDSKLENPSYYLTNNQPELTSSYRFVSQPTHDRAGIYSLDVNKQWSAVELTSLTALFDRKVDWERDYSFFVGNLFATAPLYPLNSYVIEPYHTKTFTQELRLSSTAGSNARLRWVAGLYYSEQKENVDPLLYTYEANGILAAMFPTTYQPGSNISLFEHTAVRLEQSAAFGEASYRISDALDVTAGLRLFEIERKADTTINGPLNGGFTESHRRVKEDGVNPKVGLSYKVNDAHLLYTSAAKGFRPGGQSSLALSVNCAGDLQRLGLSNPGSLPGKYESDNLWTYELGSKNEFADNRIVLNGALFYTDWKEIQQTIRLPSCGSSITTNAGDARVQGVELEAQINVTPAFKIGGNVTYTDAEIVNTGGSQISQKGDKVIDVPEWMASAYGSYSIPLNASWTMQLRADYAYRGEQTRVFDATQTARFPPTLASVVIPYGATVQEGYDVVNAGLSFDKGPTLVRLYVNNALDARPDIDTAFSVGISRSMTIRPRSFGVELQQKF